MKLTLLSLRGLSRHLCLIASMVALATTPGRLLAAPGDFTVESPADGKTFKLSEAKGRYVALHFLLKTECPFCLKHTRDYARASATTPDVLHVFLKPDSADEIKSWVAKANQGDGISPLSIYRDPDASLARQFGIPGGYQFHGETVHYPALILLDPAGREVFRYVGKSNADRFSHEQFTAKLDQLKQKSTAAIRHYNLDSANVALKGYDPVSYFTKIQPMKGRRELSAQHRGVTYWFASEANRKLFVESPGKHLPTYGGWCATAMARGEKVEIDPTNFKVTEGRLFLFYKGIWGNARKEWDSDESALTSRADASWRKITGE